MATLIEVTKCGRRQIVYEDPKTLKEKKVDPKKVIREGFDCFKDGFEGNSYLAVMVFRLGRFRSFMTSKHFTSVILIPRICIEIAHIVCIVAAKRSHQVSVYLTECPEARQDKKVQNILNRVHPIIRRNMQRDATKKQTWWKGRGSVD